MHVYDIEMLAVIKGGGENTVVSDDDIPTDAITAAYELPHLPGFEKQDEMVKKLKQEGKLFDAAPIEDRGFSAFQPMTLDPLRGVGIPKVREDGDADG